MLLMRYAPDLPLARTNARACACGVALRVRRLAGLTRLTGSMNEHSQATTPLDENGIHPVAGAAAVRNRGAVRSLQLP
jgi:hypothetical protein